MYFGQFKDGRYNGIGTFYNSLTGTYSGYYKDGFADGVGRNTYLDGSVYIGTWRNGL